MNKLIISIVGILVIMGCARVRVEAPKDPIKVDIAMRLDIYQHIQKDIDDIENIVAGGKGAVVPGQQSFLRIFVTEAFAQESLSAGIEEAATRRKMRVQQLNDFESRGIVGENNAGLVEARNAAGAEADAADLVAQENKDRMIIYQALAQKNGVSVSEIQRVYAQRLQQNASAGTPIQTLEGNWTKK
jgi:uncharacterized protein